MHGESFFRRIDATRFEATQWTRGPWSDAHQHAGPPSALVGGRLEEALAPGFRVARVAVEVTRPVPIGPLRLEIDRRREGRTVHILVGQLFDDDDKLVLRAEALSLAEADSELPRARPSMDEPTLERSSPVEFPFFKPGPGYAAAMELRFARGVFGEGDVMAWMRMRLPLFPSSSPSPLERVLTAADSGNGVSQRLSTRDYTFLNPDLVVTLHRPAEGEWIGLAARTDMDGRGIGVADTRLYDGSGPIGRGVQTLLIRARDPSGLRG